MGGVRLKASRCSREELRKYQGFEGVSDEEAERTIDTVERLAHILLSIVKAFYQSNEQSNNSSRLREGKKER
jgi:hypothetical protein